MRQEEIIKIMKCIEDDTIDHLPDLLEPFKPYGRAIGALVQVIRNGGRTIQDVVAECNIEDIHKEMRDLYEKLGAPYYMSCVVYLCSKGKELKQEQKEILEEILLQKYDSLSRESLHVVEAFISKYMGENVDQGNIHDYKFGRNSITLYFEEFGGTKEFRYNKGDLNLMKSALNTLLGEEVFDYFLVDGHDESNKNE